MLAYRLLVDLHDERHQIERLVREQLHAWLRRKGYDANALVPGTAVKLADRVEGQLEELTRQDGSRSFRARITENNPTTGKWATHLTVHVPRQAKQQPWLWLDVDAPEGKRAAVPRLARNLLEVCDARGGGVQFDSSAVIAGTADVGDVVESVCDPERRRLVFVAGSDDRAPDLRDKWRDYVDALLSDTTGLAAAYVLDPAATAEFNNAVGPAHEVTPWTVRTFRPEVKPDDRVDASRHRILTTQRILSDSSKSIATMLGRRAREAALAAPLPRAFTRVDHEFQSKTDERLLDRLAQSASPVLATATSKPVFDDDVLAELRERLQKYEARNTELELDLHELNKRLEDLWVEYAVAQDELNIARDEHTSAQATVRSLQVRLAYFGHAEEAYTQTKFHELEAPPGDYEALLKRIEELDSVEFTGKTDPVLELDDHDQLGAWVGKIWDVLRALQDYATASIEGFHNGGVHQYLQNTPAGCRPYSVDRHARGESEDVKTNPEFRAARMLPVPTSVDQSGKAYMEAHFKIAKYGLISPRLHYLDHVKTSGKIYVGYIGRHLPTKQTN